MSVALDPFVDEMQTAFQKIIKLNVSANQAIIWTERTARRLNVIQITTAVETRDVKKIFAKLFVSWIIHVDLMHYVLEKIIK